MKKLNIKKLKLNKSTVNTLSKEQSKKIVGGRETFISPCAVSPTWLCCTKEGSGPPSENCCNMDWTG